MRAVPGVAPVRAVAKSGPDVTAGEEPSVVVDPQPAKAAIDRA